jgi:hypothetical protein
MTAGTSGNIHGAFGLRIESAFVLPEYPCLRDDGRAADLVIERGRIGKRLGGSTRLAPAMQVAPCRFQLEAPAGRFRVSRGQRILVDAREGATDADLRPYLLGTVMGALCHQRGLLPLHAAAVIADGGAVAFAGPSGAGKSTLAAEFHGRGYDVLSDDLLAVEIDPDGAPKALPGAARIRLRTGTPGLVGAAGVDGKFSLPIPSPTTAPLRRLYVLNALDEDASKVCPLHGPEAVAAIVDHVYRWPIAVGMGRGGTTFAQCAALAARCEVFDVSFRHATGSPTSLVDTLEAHLSPRSTPRSPGIGAAL